MEGSTVGKAKELPADTDLVTNPSNGQEKGHPDESKRPSNPQKLDTAYGSTCNESDIVTLTLAEQPKTIDLSPPNSPPSAMPGIPAIP
ncbi:hypothetical protein FRUB_10037 [Fimbriiglobus ruber]|uniref:Uncharacterized protein n=2 Tax=Fimbriiglobus ruber TaxID=1908690 RepID=A0A225DFM3_9BACT|nr:hypothetical protein FRUB_10037 [Fimbriiglobus ruber]